MHYRLSYYLRRPWELWTELVWRPTKYFIYRLRHGFDIRDTWSLDIALAKWILPRLKKFKEVNVCWPSIENDPNCDTPEHWDETIDKMIWSFQDIVTENKDFYKWRDNVDAIGHQEQYKRRKEGLELFGKYLQALWW